MLDLQELQILAQLIDNIDILTQRVERAYAENNAEAFNNFKNEILIVQKKINEILNLDK